MKLKHLPIAKIKIPEVRITAVYDEELQALLRDSLAAMGQVQPIVVVQSGEDFFLVDGLHRLQDARDKGQQSIEAVVYEGAEKDVLLKNLVLNRLRGKTKAGEMVKVISSLWQDYGMDSVAIQEATGLGRDYIEKLQKISLASPSVQEALDKEVIGVGHAFEISRLPSLVAQDEIVGKYPIWHWTVKELHDQIDRVLEAMKELSPEAISVEPRPKPVYSCEGCKMEADLRYLRPVLLCPNCFGLIWRQAQQPPPQMGGAERGGIPASEE